MKVGIDMNKANNGLRLVHVSRIIRSTELREATTGRPVAVPRIWAVAEPGIAEPAIAEPASPQPKSAPQPAVELAFYRKYTEAMLRRYLRVSMEVGRVPSIMGREMFRGNVSHCKTEGLEDGVIFCVDVERCLAKLRKQDQRLLQRIAIQGYTHEEAGPLLGLSFRWCVVYYGRALDRLTEIFLSARLLQPQKCCQAPAAVEKPATVALSTT